MSRLLPIAEQLLMMGALSSRAAPRPQDRLYQTIYAVSGVLAVIALICLAAAFSYWLRQQYTPDVAALVAGLGMLALALLVAAVGYAVSVIRKNKIEAVTDEIKNKVLHALESVADEMEDPIRDHPKSSVAIATLAGYLVGNRL